MSKVILMTGTLMCAISVASGAFGAHALADTISIERLGTWQTASQYLMYHGLGLLIVSQLGITLNISFTSAAIQMLAGACVFSISLYLLVLLNMPWLGALAPVGGLLMITGWLTSAVILFKRCYTES